MVEFLAGPWKGHFASMEPYLEGNYVKHNSNHPAGLAFTERNTPQTFSHFTFQYTKGEELVVDIQGVDDNYTDPQVWRAYD